MQELIAENYPGTKLQIGEWNFGAEQHVSGALAVAEVLGRFAEFGLDSAFYWQAPKKDLPVFQGFLAYRNYDGKGARFHDELVKSEAPIVTNAGSDVTKVTLWYAVNVTIFSVLNVMVSGAL